MFPILALVVALLVVAVAVAVVFKMFQATQETKFGAHEVGLLFGQLRDSLEGFRRAAEAAGADSVTENADGTLRAEKLFPIDENQALCAVLGSSDTEVRVLRWQTVYTGNWAPDDGIELWNIEPEE